MKVFRSNRIRTDSSRTNIPYSRRYFLKSTGILISLYFIPLSACKRIFGDNEVRPNINRLSSSEIEILRKVHNHLLPSEGEGPGAKDINASSHFEFVLANKHLEVYNRKLLINGIRWVEETSVEMFEKSIGHLTHEQTEIVLRDLESFKNGEKWLSKIISYIFEALLGSPAYGINTDEIGWKWLGHVPGMPQPLNNKLYGSYGYGI